MNETFNSVGRCTPIKPKYINGLPEDNAVPDLRIMRVRIIKATGLVKKDVFSTSDPYCRLTLYKNDQSATVIGVPVNTKTKKNTLEPIWNEEFLFRVDPNESNLVIELYNQRKMGRDGHRGLVSIHLSQLEVSTESTSSHINPKSFKLRSKKNKSIINGNIIIYLAFISGDVDLSSLTTMAISHSDNNLMSMEVNGRSEDVLSNPLPEGWEEKIDQNGRTYYVDHKNKRTQWARPTNNQLPHGWKEKIDANGRVFYFNERTQKSQWAHPSVRFGGSSRSTLSEPNEPLSHYFYKNRRPLPETPSTEEIPTQPSQSATEEEAATMFHRRRPISHEDLLLYRSRQKKSKNKAHNSASKSRHSTNPNTSLNDADLTPVVEDEILPGWQVGTAANGQRYFINHNNHTTTWEDPRAARHRARSVSALPVSVSSPCIKTSSCDDLLADLGPLPPGWEEREHTDGRIFFVNHNKKTTQWEDPRLKKFCSPAIPYNRSYKKKYDFFRSQLRQPEETNSKFELKINRKTLFEDSYRFIINVKQLEMLKYKLWINFIGEKGLDYGGVQREWFFLLSREMFNPYYGLFEYSATDNYTLQINPLSGLANENHLHYFKFIGRVLGMAVYHGRLIDGFFIRPIYKMMLGKKITLNDMESVDLEYFRSLQYILDNDPADLNLFYSIDEEHFGETKEIDLVSDGKNKSVTQANKKEYIDCLINWRFVKRVEHQMKAFLDGFKDVIDIDKLQIFDANELELLMCGLQDINVDDWKANTKYKGGYDCNHPVIVNFWKIMYTFNNELRARLLQFVTGTSRVPMNGFAELWGSNGLHMFTIEKWGTTNQLPRAHTCFNRLDLPDYQSFDELRARILFAIENTEGFEGVD